MPELPEVETVRQSLLPEVGQAVIRQFEVYQPEVLIHNHLTLDGWQIKTVRRRGKYLLFDLDARPGLPARPPALLIVHLRMTGRLLIRSLAEPPPKHTHVRLHLTNKVGDFWLDFHDVRRFGRIWLCENQPLDRPESGPPGLKSLGPEPFDRFFSAAYLAEKISSRPRCSLKAMLLDQTVVAGLGNIYADEALFAAGLEPSRPAASLSAVERERLVEAVREVLDYAISCQGTSLRDYVDGWNRQGRFQECLMVYGRSGQPCRTCSTAIAKKKLAGRTTCWCPECQS